jgi:hypothetical protein
MKTVENTTSKLEAKENASGESLPLPYLTPGGTLVIPFASDPKYHWWNGGQSVEQTRVEVRSWMAAASADQSNAGDFADRKDEVV